MRRAVRGSGVRSSPYLPTRIVRGAGGGILRPATIPAPYKGWDASSPLENMDPASAVVLDNWFPETQFVRFRAGHRAHATGLGSGAVESVMAWHGPDGTAKLFGARGTSIFDCTASGAVGSAAVTSLTNARFQHVQFTTPGGTFLMCVNGAAAPQAFSGTSWSVPSITGFTTTQAIHVNAHKNRLWFILAESTKAAYLPVSSIAGAASVYDFGPLMTKGGYLVAMGTWTQDAGWGPDDLAVFVTSRGQAIVFAGNDPASADSWAYKGTYNLGAPIGRRCLTNVGGDLAIVTVDGVVSLAQAITLDRAAAKRVAITQKIQPALNAAAKQNGTNYGWGLTVYPKGTAAFLNVPLIEGKLVHQYVMNTVNGAWCRYTGQNLVCWEVFNDRIFGGGLNGTVYEADVGNLDGDSLIVGDIKTAFNHFGTRGLNKRFSMARALMSSDGRASPVLTLNTDYSDEQPAALASAFVNSGALWNDFDWNDGTNWAGGVSTLSDWITVNGEGSCAAVRMRMAPDNQSSQAAIRLEVNGFEVRWEPSVGVL